jgi:hypothetical protein
MFYKKGFIVFLENDECKYVDLESLEIYEFSMGEEPVDFCIV